MAELDLTAAIGAVENAINDEINQQDILVRSAGLSRIAEAAVRAAAPLIERAVLERVAKSLDTEEFADRVADKTEEHHITDNLDADLNNICACGEWADTSELEGWDQHIARVSMGFVAEVITDG